MAAPPGNCDASVAATARGLCFNRRQMGRHHPGSLRRARRIARLVGAIAGLVFGVLYAAYVIPQSDGAFTQHLSLVLVAVLGSGAVGLGSGALAGPLLSVEPFLWLETIVETVTAGELAGGVAGLLVALTVSALVAVILGGLPGGLGLLIAAGVAATLVYVGVGAGMRRGEELAAWAGRRPAAPGPSPQAAVADVLDAGPAPAGTPAVVDTSVLIDGRIVDLARIGFLPPRLLIPGFVLEEMQRLADSADPMRRARGKRGLRVVEELQAGGDVPCEVVDRDFPATPEVDARLVRLARALGASVMTNDHNLGSVARIEGLRVLNLNDLALAMRPPLSAGETMEVTIVKAGHELNQGVAYLDDGTMVVVENGRGHLERTVTATVTSVLQTPSGRMIFAVVEAAQAPRRAPRGARGARVAER
jgi:uncharacterized protein YacL